MHKMRPMSKQIVNGSNSAFIFRSYYHHHHHTLSNELSSHFLTKVNLIKTDLSSLLPLNQDLRTSSYGSCWNNISSDNPECHVPDQESDSRRVFCNCAIQKSWACRMTVMCYMDDSLIVSLCFNGISNRRDFS